ncbi:F-box/WD repeat-containing protein 12 [Dugong dugon]
MPCKMEVRLPDFVMLKIFSFLDGLSLLQASQVNKTVRALRSGILFDYTVWAQHPEKMRWTFCSSDEHLDAKHWKQFFLKQVKQEYRMALAQPEDFTRKEVYGSVVPGPIGPVAYLSGSGLSVDGQNKSIVCVVSKHTLYVWDVQKGTTIWVSPDQRSHIECMTTLPQRHLAFTVDLEKTIKVWNCRDRDALAVLTMPQRCFSMEAFLTKDGSFLMVSDYEGDIYTFTVPELRYISNVNEFKYRGGYLLCSPDKKWISVFGTKEYFPPKVFFTECVLNPSEGNTPLSLPIPFAWCWNACWASKKTNRIIVIFRRDFNEMIRITTFDFTAEMTGGKIAIQAHQIASLPLPVVMEFPSYIGSNDGNVIVLEDGPYLSLFTINGLLLQRFQDHQKFICNMWVDPIHVLTSSVDNSLHVYMWEEEGCHPYLRSCCHLEKVAGDQTPSW